MAVKHAPDMKRAALIICVLAVILAVSFFIIKARIGVTDPAALVSSDAVAFVALPDLPQTLQRWPATALAKIGAEPTVAEFLEKPFTTLSESGGTEAMDILMEIKPGRVFGCIESVREDGVSAALGFQFFGNKEQVVEALSRMHAEIEKGQPDGAVAVVDADGLQITSSGVAPVQVFSGISGNWAVVASDLETAKTILARVQSRDAATTLAGSPEFVKMRNKMPSRPDALWFVNPAPLIDLMLAVGADDATVDPAQVEQLRRIEGIVGSFAFEGLNQKEIVFIGMTGELPALPPVTRETLAITSADTMLFYAAAQDWQSASEGGAFDAVPDEVRAMLVQFGIDLDALHEVFAGDAAFALNWPVNAMFPTGLAAVSIEDRAKAGTALSSVIGLFAPGAVVSEKFDATIYEFPQAGIQLLDPTVALTDDLLMVASNASLLTPILDSSAKRTTLADNPMFQGAASDWTPDANAFLYADTRGIFERVYNAARPVLIFGASLVPDATKYIDVSKLPETTTISQHLSPIVFSQKSSDGGFLLESSGPITLYQAIILIAGGAGAGFAAQGLTDFP